MAKNTLTFIETKIVGAGVKNLKEFGYPHCNAQNILNDQIYSAFFRRMLEDNLGKGYDESIKSLLQKLPKE